MFEALVAQGFAEDGGKRPPTRRALRLPTPCAGKDGTERRVRILLFFRMQVVPDGAAFWSSPHVDNR